MSKFPDLSTPTFLTSITPANLGWRLQSRWEWRAGLPRGGSWEVWANRIQHALSRRVQQCNPVHGGVPVHNIP